MKKKIALWSDGDSGRFSSGEFFRLARVRAPEKHQFGGEHALRSAAGMTGRYDNRVNATVLGRDAYNRVLVNLSNPDGSVNNRLIRRGYSNKGR